MQYLILHNGEAFYTKWYDYQNNWVEGMIVFDLSNDKYSTNGVDWMNIEYDHL